MEMKMGLELKGACEKCEATLAPGGVAYICTYECTFCAGLRRANEFRLPEL